MFKIIFADGALVKKCTGGSSGVGFRQSRNAELSHTSRATSPDFEARAVLCSLVMTLAVRVICQRGLQEHVLCRFRRAAPLPGAEASTVKWHDFTGPSALQARMNAAC